jgi:uncharacterized membrane protein YbaN (DUF454 family)
MTEEDFQVEGIIKNNLLRTLFIILGVLMVFLGFIGLFLPVFPTVPFLLLAAFFFARSSKKFYIWLITNRFFGDHIRDYRERRGVRLHVKIFTIVFLWLSITFSALVFVNNIYVRAVMFTIAVLVTIHILLVKTLRDT